jgi:hypothetical protein
MSQDSAPTETSRAASAEKQALLEAYDTVLKHQAEAREAEAREAEARRRRRNRVRPVVSIFGAMTLVLCSYLWIERPAWLFPPTDLPESSAVKEASIRIGMANAAQHVLRYRQRHNRLPDSLGQAGAYGEGIQYVRVGDSGWRMMTAYGTDQITLRSEDPLPAFIGKSFEVIARRRQ